MHKMMENFYQQIDGVLESDYGDYLRQVNYHLNNLKEEVERLPYEDVCCQVTISQHHLLYQDTGGRSLTHNRLLEDIKMASQLLDAHQQDGESKFMRASQSLM